MHGGGAARIAYEAFGAIWGQGVGLQGQSYAIPTMQGSVDTIKPYVDEFIAFARKHPELFFYVTRIGCGSSWTYTDSPSGSIDCSGLQSALNGVGGTLMSDRYICTEGARVDFTETTASFGFTDNSWYVRAVLAF